MPFIQYSPQRQSYAYYAAGSVNVNTAYPVTMMLNLADRTQSTRSSSTTATKICIDFGANTVIGAFSIEGVNFGSLQLQASLAATPATMVAAGTFTTTAIDKEDRRRKWLCIPTISWNHRYATLTPSSPDAGADYFEIQNCGAWPTLTTMISNVEVPYRKTHFDKAQVFDLESAGEEIGPSPSIRLLIGASAKFDRQQTADLDLYLEVAAIPRNRVWLWYENQADLTKMYHVTKAESVEITRNIGTWEMANLQLREVG